jgi:cell wall-associated NlpC family hydrolase
MRRLVGLCLLLSCAAIAAGAARAAGPVFVFVSGSGSSRSLRQAIGRALEHERRELLDVRRTRRSHARLFQQTEAAQRRALDPFPDEDRAVRLQHSLEDLAARIQALTHEIHGLQLALQPLRLPARFASEPPSTIGAFAVSIAERYLGVAYRWGGANPSSGFDCSGFVEYVYAQLGIRLPHYAASQFADTAHIAPDQLEPGDLVFFEPRADGPGHVGLYVGSGMFIEAPHTGDVVKFEPLTTEANLLGYVGASRPVV